MLIACRLSAPATSAPPVISPMSALDDLLSGLPQEKLLPGTYLTTAGTRSGQLYLLESGTLTVTRDGVELATLEERGAIIGEMAALLDIPHSANVVARTPVAVRVVSDARTALASYPALALHIATLACARLDATSALLVELRTASQGADKQQALMTRILGAISMTPKRGKGSWADHE